MVNTHSELTRQLSGLLAEPNIRLLELVQPLWSGYGQLVRFQAGAGRSQRHLIAKHIVYPAAPVHPRGWNTAYAHQRKMHSYQCEVNFYRHFALQCDPHCPVAECVGIAKQPQSQLIVLQDLDSAGFSRRFDSAFEPSLDIDHVHSCLRWLAYFHARFLGVKPTGLWPRGSYWQLLTRPDEWQALVDTQLQQAAHGFHQQLHDGPYQTLLHGDAKVANFCISADGRRAAAVDFQYAGGGAGIKDVVYLLSSCLSGEQLLAHEASLLDFYFGELEQAIMFYHPPHQSAVNPAAVAQHWRSLYDIAWADFARFLIGWRPGHSKLNAVVQQKLASALAVCEKQGQTVAPTFEHYSV